MSISTTILMAIIIFLMTIISGAIPFIMKLKEPQKYDFPIGEALTSGVFLGAGLIHILADASKQFSNLNYNYPWAFVICGTIFLVFLLSDHIGFFIRENNRNQSFFIAIASTIMLSIHSFFTGTALGISTSMSLSIILFIAIIAHKWAASFALAVYINKTHLTLLSRLSLFLIFSLMVPLGIYSGDVIHTSYSSQNLLQPILLSVAAGTFIYLGTIHGLRKITTNKKAHNLSHYFYVTVGFVLMAIVAIWL